MKQIVVPCFHCGHKINHHDHFERVGNDFFHALCYQLSLLECVKKGSADTRMQASQEISMLVNGGEHDPGRQ